MQSQKLGVTTHGRFTRCPEGISLTSQHSQLPSIWYWLDCVLQGSIHHRHRPWDALTGLWSQLMHFFFGSISIWTAAYHPKASSLVDCFHHQLKISLHVMVHSSHWEEALPMVLFSIRMSRSMAEIPYKSTLCIPGPPSQLEPFHWDCHSRNTPRLQLCAQPVQDAAFTDLNGWPCDMIYCCAVFLEFAPLMGE